MLTCAINTTLNTSRHNHDGHEELGKVNITKKVNSKNYTNYTNRTTRRSIIVMSGRKQTAAASNNNNNNNNNNNIFTLSRTRSKQLASDVLASASEDTIRALAPKKRNDPEQSKKKALRAKKGNDDEEEDEAARYGLTNKNSVTGLTIPTMLTLARVAAIPVFAYVYYQTGKWTAPLCCFIFILAALTDWLDGYLARKWNQSSAFGAFLDPVADKLMVACALVLLCSLAPMNVAPYVLAVPSSIIIGREITMSALREWASAKGGDAHKAVKVNNLGKWKTATQMIAISILLLVRDGIPTQINQILPSVMRADGLLSLIQIGVVTLWASAALAALSLYVYMAPVLKYMLE